LNELGIGPRLKIGYSEKIYRAIFEKSAHSAIFYDFNHNFAVFNAFFYKLGAIFTHDA
jgi:hypothetical protein